MFKIVLSLLFTVAVAATIVQCKSTDKREAVARQYCGSCHLFPEPALLDKATWINKVLPAMGKIMGVKSEPNSPFGTSDDLASRQVSSISLEDWQSIVSFYNSQAPETMKTQDRPPVEAFTDRFVVKRPASIGTPANTFLQINSTNHWIYAANRTDSSLYTYDAALKLIQKQSLHGVVVDLFKDTLDNKKGSEEIVATRIGIMDPNDFRTGSIVKYSMDKSGKFSQLSPLFDTLARPVQTLQADLDSDGKPDYLICAYGNKKGSLYWMKNNGNNKFETKFLRNEPGAIKAYIKDYNGDGKPDIIALFAQAAEGIFLFVNKGNGEFETKEIMRFPPVYGSSYFELTDFNKDGHPDIVYTCGDNADYSSNALKSFHGVYVFINNGDFTFKQQYFFPIHGAFKAVARDFDKDGDMDLAVISFFPDKKKQPKEAFVYLENKGNMSFEPSTIREFNEGNWITMDAADVDQDCDDDIVIGSLYLPNQAAHLEPSAQKPFFLLLQNRTVN